jgi:hypothetical protein
VKWTQSLHAASAALQRYKITNNFLYSGSIDNLFYGTG